MIIQSFSQYTCTPGRKSIVCVVLIFCHDLDLVISSVYTYDFHCQMSVVSVCREVSVVFSSSILSLLTVIMLCI